jgi:hypothetical protein
MGHRRAADLTRPAPLGAQADVLTLDDQGRITVDYVFVEG